MGKAADALKGTQVRYNDMVVIKKEHLNQLGITNRGTKS